jgi:hypothetical protein
MPKPPRYSRTELTIALAGRIIATKTESNIPRFSYLNSIDPNPLTAFLNNKAPIDSDQASSSKVKAPDAEIDLLGFEESLEKELSYEHDFEPIEVKVSDKNENKAEKSDPSAVFVFRDNKIADRKVAYFAPCKDNDTQATSPTLNKILELLQDHRNELKECPEWVIPVAEAQGRSQHWVTLYVKRNDENIQVTLYDPLPAAQVAFKQYITRDSAIKSIDPENVIRHIANIFQINEKNVVLEACPLSCQENFNNVDCGPWNVKIQELLLKGIAPTVELMKKFNIANQRLVDAFIFNVVLTSQHRLLVKIKNDFSIKPSKDRQAFSDADFLEEFFTLISSKAGDGAVYTVNHKGNSISLTPFEAIIFDILKDSQRSFNQKLVDIYNESDKCSSMSGSINEANNTADLLKKYGKFCSMLVCGTPLQTAKLVQTPIEIDGFEFMSLGSSQ